MMLRLASLKKSTYSSVTFLPDAENQELGKVPYIFYRNSGAGNRVGYHSL